MKKIIIICWDGQYRLTTRIQDELKDIADVMCYCSSKLEDGRIDALLYNIADSDVVIMSHIADCKVAFDINKTISRFSVPRIKVTMKKHLIPCNTIAHTVNTYWEYGGNENFINMIKYVLNKVLGENVDFMKPEKLPFHGIFHPNSNEVFKSTKEYMDWYGKDKPMVGLIVSRYNWVNDNLNIEKAVIEAIEKKGYGVLPVFSYFDKNKALGAVGLENAMRKIFLTDKGETYVDCIIKLTGFSCGRGDVYKEINCPVIKPVCSSDIEINQLKANEINCNNEIVWDFECSEQEGCIEPVYIGGNHQNSGGAIERLPYDKGVETLTNRIDNWIKLRHKRNKEKRVVIVYSADRKSVTTIIEQLEQAEYLCSPRDEVVKINCNIQYNDFGNIRIYKQNKRSSLKSLKEMYHNISEFQADAIVHVGDGLLLPHRLKESFEDDANSFTAKVLCDKPSFYLGSNDNLEDAVLFKRKALTVAIRWDENRDISALADGLCGKYIPVGNNNKQAFALLPSDMVPTKEAWEKGSKMADDIADWNEYKQTDVTLEDMGIDGGIELCKALNIMGIKPIWNSEQKVTEFKPIAKCRLKRDRVKVEVNPLFHGYYKKCFGKSNDAIDKIFV